MSSDGVGNPVNVDASNVFEPLLQIVQNHEFNVMSSFDKFMGQGAHVVSDVP
jgi:hypothetical protein